MSLIKDIKGKYFNRKFFKEFLLINLGVFLVALSFETFLDRYNIIVGGVSGLSIILNNTVLSFIPTPLIVLIINTVLLLIALLFLGKSFFFKTVYGSIMFPVYAWLIAIMIKSIPPDNLFKIEQDYFIIVVISAVIMGSGLGLAIKYGASTGGTDILQYIFLKYFKMPLSFSLIFIDGVVIVIGAFINNSFASVLYGITFVFISGYFLDNIVFGGFNVRAAHIITKKSDEVKQKIYQTLGRGVTELYSRGGYSGIDNKMLVCVMTTREYYILRSIVQEIDSEAFMYVMKASEVRGEGFTYEPKK